jgi:hypothetical protein
MRRFPLTAAALVALALAACSKEPAKQPVEAASAAPVVETPAPPAPPTAEVVEASAAPEAVPAPIPIATKPRAPPERVIKVIPARERRIHALINNAIARDVTGQTEHDAEMWEATRAACKTQACVDRAYAAQETELRKWEGSEAIP